MVADALRLKVFKLVTCVTKGYTITNIKTKIGMSREGLDMVGAKIAALIVAALLTGMIKIN